MKIETWPVQNPFYLVQIFTVVYRFLGKKTVNGKTVKTVKKTVKTVNGKRRHPWSIARKLIHCHGFKYPKGSKDQNLRIEQPRQRLKIYNLKLGFFPSSSFSSIQTMSRRSIFFLIFVKI